MKKDLSFLDRHLATLILIVLLLGSGIAYVIWADSAFFKKSGEDVSHGVGDLEKSFMDIMISEQIDKASIQSSNMKTYLKDMLSLKYEKNEEKLKEDLLNPHPDLEAYKIMSVIQDKYINNKSCSNDMFIANKSGILSDFSLETSTDVKGRTWDEEIKRHYNKKLAEKAIKDIVGTNKLYTVWQFSKPTGKASSMPMYEDVNISDFNEIYELYGIEGLRSFEIVVVSRIEDNKDIFGDPDVDFTGIRKENLKIFVAQSINVGDIYERNAREFLKQIKNEEKDINNFFRNYEYMRQLMQIIVLLMFSSIALSLMLYKNRSQSKGD